MLLGVPAPGLAETWPGRHARPQSMRWPRVCNISLQCRTAAAESTGLRSRQGQPDNQERDLLIASINKLNQRHVAALVESLREQGLDATSDSASATALLPGGLDGGGGRPPAVCMWT